MFIGATLWLLVLIVTLREISTLEITSTQFDMGGGWNICNFHDQDGVCQVHMKRMDVKSKCETKTVQFSDEDLPRELLTCADSQGTILNCAYASYGNSILTEYNASTGVCY